MILTVYSLLVKITDLKIVSGGSGCGFSTKFESSLSSTVEWSAASINHFQDKFGICSGSSG